MGPDGATGVGATSETSVAFTTASIVADHGPYPNVFHVRTLHETRPRVNVRGAAIVHVPTPAGHEAWAGVTQTSVGDAGFASVIDTR